MLWGMGQMGPVLVSVLFTLNSVTKLNSVKRLCSQTHLDTVVRAPAHTLARSCQTFDLLLRSRARAEDAEEAPRRLRFLCCLQYLQL